MTGNSLYLDAVTRMTGGLVYGQNVSGRYMPPDTQVKESGKSDFGKLIEAAERKREPLDEKGMEKYREEIYRKIAGLPMHSSRQCDSVEVRISDEGLAAMWKDPEYEQWVLNTLAKDFAVYNPWAGIYGGNLAIHRFGADKSEYRGDSFAMGFLGGRKSLLEDEEEEEGFWERRARISQEYLEARQNPADPLLFPDSEAAKK